MYMQTIIILPYNMLDIPVYSNVTYVEGLKVYQENPADYALMIFNSFIKLKIF